MKTLLTPLAFLALTLSLHADFPIGPEFLPSYIDKHESKLVVPVGETVTLSTPSDFDAVEVRGTLKIRANLRYINLTVAEGGILDIGTATDPVLTPIEIVKKDVPLDTAFDPFQWGHGIQCFGSWSVHGRKLMQTWSLIQPVEAGATTLTLDYIPADWQVGDSLLIPDTKQLGLFTLNVDNSIRRESPVTIEAIEGNVITLSKPLGFEHLSVYRVVQGKEEVQRPVVANCTRNIVFSSENPNEINRRGHTAVIHTGSADVRYASFIGLGRTTGAVLNNTPLDRSRIGTNQIAKYGFHWHHAAHHSADHGGGHLIGCYLNGQNLNKWGVVVHASHNMHVEQNVIADFSGANLVTEDGYERDYLFKDNFCYGAKGNGNDADNNMNPAKLSPGAEGAGIWNHSPLGRTVGNVCVNNTVGIGYMYLGQVSDPLSGAKAQVKPTENRANIALSNDTGLEEWQAPSDFYFQDCIAANNETPVREGRGSINLLNCKLCNTKIEKPVGQRVSIPYIGIGVHSTRAYSQKVGVYGGFISGCGLALRDAQTVVFDKVDLRGNQETIRHQFYPFKMTVIDSPFESWNTTHCQPITPWAKPGDSFGPNNELDEWSDEGPPITLIQGEKKYGLFLKNSQNQNDLAPIPNHAGWGSPIPGLTRKQVHDQFGIANLGANYDPTKAVELPGLIGAVGVEFSGEEYPHHLGPARAIVTVPNSWPGTVPKYENGLLAIRVILSGNPTGLGPNYHAQVDDGPVKVFGPRTGMPFYLRSHSIAASQTEGQHIVRTWREDAAGNRLESTKLEFAYRIGDTPPPPPLEEWKPANLGPPFNGDVKLRVRNGLIEQLQ